jgi:hypothetical protein
MTKNQSQWVINFEQDSDIQVIADDLDLTVLKLRLPNTYERYLATLFFNRNSEKLAAQSQEMLAIWHFRAALSQFQSIMDLVKHDMPPNRKQIWKRDPIKETLESHRLVSTMTRVRNLALHTGKLQSPLQERTAIFLPGGRRNVMLLILCPITLDDFNEGNKPNLRFLKWFNRQATIWSANELLTEATFVLLAALDNFVRMNFQHIAQQNNALDKIRHAKRALSCE